MEPLTETFMPYRTVLALCLLVFLGGCQTRADRALARSPDYKAGYSDGCATAGSRGANMRGSDGMIRDDAAFRENKAYRSGWGLGFSACRSTTSGGGNPMPGRGPIADPGTRRF